MTDIRADDPLQRVAKAERIVSLDVLRGFAILFILVMNIPIMGGYFTVQPFDPRLVSWTPADQFAFQFVGAFLDGTQRGLLEVLFGAGMMIMARKGMTPDSPISVADLHFRRNLWLIAFGLFHAFVLLWPGDILFAYGIGALFVFPFRTISPRAKAIIGALVILTAIVPNVQRYAERVDLQRDMVAAEAKLKAGKTPTADEKKALESWKEKVEAAKPIAQNKKKQDAVAKEKKERLGPLVPYWQLLSSMWAEFNVGPFFYFGFFEIFGTMLLGMALYEWGIVQGRANTRTYVAVLVVGYGFGITARQYANVEVMTFQPTPKIGWLLWDVARIALVVGHISLVNLLLRTRAGQALLGVFQAPGRMPLTVYFTASVMGMIVLFPGFGIGLGLFGRFGIAGLTEIALAIIVVQVILANLWMAAFESGPVDWVWKSLVYWKRQPFRKVPAPHAVPAAAE